MHINKTTEYIPKRSSTQQTNNVYIYRISYRTQYCPRPTNNNNNMKISCVRPHTHTTHLRCLAIDINRIIERSINQSCNLLCFICVSCCCFAFIEQKTQTNRKNTYQNTIKCWLLFPVNNRYSITDTNCFRATNRISLNLMTNLNKTKINMPPPP